MIRFAFSIRTRTGQRVDNICIMTASRAEAERRLRQMYLQCQIVSCQAQEVNSRNDPVGLQVLGALGPATLPGVVRAMLRNKPGAH
jgi:hypothetical protein